MQFSRIIKAAGTSGNSALNSSCTFLAARQACGLDWNGMAMASMVLGMLSSQTDACRTTCHIRKVAT